MTKFNKLNIADILNMELVNKERETLGIFHLNGMSYYRDTESVTINIECTNSVRKDVKCSSYTNSSIVGDNGNTVYCGSYTFYHIEDLVNFYNYVKNIPITMSQIPESKAVTEGDIYYKTPNPSVFEELKCPTVIRYQDSITVGNKGDFITNNNGKVMLISREDFKNNYVKYL